MIIICNFLIILLGILLNPSYSNTTFVIITLLITILAYSSMIWQSKIHIYLYYTIYIILCFMDIHALYFLPVIVFNITLSPFYFQIIPLTIGLIVIISNQLPPTILILSILSLILTYFINQFDWNQNQLYALYDQSTSHIKEREKQIEILESSKETYIQNATLIERSRIARDIHDHVGHIISSSIIQLGAIKIINQDQKLIAPLEQLSISLKDGMDAMRMSVHQLYEEGFNIETRIQSIGANLDQEVDYVFKTTGIPSSIEYEIYLISSEAFTNIKKHSHATHVSYSLINLPQFYQLKIKNNGDVSRIRDTGIGIKSIYDRVERLHGHCVIDTSNGFSIHISIPKEVL